MLFLPHSSWIPNIDLKPISSDLVSVDGTISAIYDSLFSNENFVHIGTLYLDDPLVVPTEWISACTIDGKSGKLRPVQCRVDADGKMSVFLSLKNVRSITISLDNVVIPIRHDHFFSIDDSASYCDYSPVIRLTGTIPPPVVWSATCYYQLGLKIVKKFRPKTDLVFPIISSNNWYICKVFSDGRVIVESLLSSSSSSSLTTDPIPLNSVWWACEEDTSDKISSLHKVELCNTNEQLIEGIGDHVVKRPLTLYALSTLDTPIGSIDNAPKNLVQIAIDGNRVWTKDKVMVNMYLVLPTSSNDDLSVTTPNLSSSWFHSLTPSHSSNIYEKISVAIGKGIENFAINLSVQKNFDIKQMRTLLIDKKLKMVENNVCENQSRTCLWLRSIRPRRSLSSAQIGYLSDVIVQDFLNHWGFDNILKSVKKFLISKKGDDDRLEDSLAAIDGATQVPVAPYEMNESHKSPPPPPLGSWLISGRKCVHQTTLIKNAFPEELESLYRIISWFHQFSSNETTLTHSSFLGNQDIFTNTGKWNIPDLPDIQDTLFRYMAWIYKRGYDTFISEIQTSVFPLIEDIDCESTIPMSNTSLIDEIFLGEKFIAERARALKIIYPQINEFKCYIYSSSGFNKSKNRWKSSFHLVWPDVIVDGRLAPIIRQTAVEYFLYKTSWCTFFKRMQYRLMNHFEANIWENVFDQTTSNCMNGLRMPFSNKASWVKTSSTLKYPKVENRHCFPRGTVEIKFGESVKCSSLKRIEEAEKNLTKNELENQNDIVHDRTQYKSIDKNTINRTTAFFTAMKAIGGDSVSDTPVSVEWTETVVDPKTLSEEEIYEWIKRGSCRRGIAKITEFCEKFVDEFETADLKIFDGHSIESLRRTDIWAKMTPAAQAGLKTRFRKYLLRKSSGTIKEEEPPQVEESTICSDDESIASPPIDDETDTFDAISVPLEYMRRFDGTVNEFEKMFKGCYKSSNGGLGYWVHTNTSVSWISERAERGNGWGSFVDVYGKSHAVDSIVKVSFYHHCGKVVVASNDNKSKSFLLIVKAVKSFTEPDDGVYHRLVLPNMSDDSFRLLEEDELVSQREEYEKRWLCMNNASQVCKNS